MFAHRRLSRLISIAGCVALMTAASSCAMPGKTENTRDAISALAGQLIPVIQSQAGDGKDGVAVLVSRFDGDAEIGAFLAAELHASLAGTTGIRVIDRKNLELFYDELEKAATSFDNGDMSVLGRELAADVVITGEVQPEGDSGWFVRAFAANCATTEVVGKGETKVNRTDELLQRAANRARPAGYAEYKAKAAKDLEVQFLIAAKRSFNNGGTWQVDKLSTGDNLASGANQAIFGVQWEANQAHYAYLFLYDSEGQFGDLGAAFGDVAGELPAERQLRVPRPAADGAQQSMYLDDKTGKECLIFAASKYPFTAEELAKFREAVLKVPKGTISAVDTNKQITDAFYSTMGGEGLTTWLVTQAANVIAGGGSLAKAAEDGKYGTRGYVADMPIRGVAGTTEEKPVTIFDNPLRGPTDDKVSLKMDTLRSPDRIIHVVTFIHTP